MRVFLLLLLMNFAVVSNAQTVSVATGEHESFSRMVFTFPSQPEWSLVRTSAGYSLVIKGAVPKYDLSDIYRRISNNRLRSIKWDSDTVALQLEVTCTCFAMPFEFRNGVVVIDIKDGQAPEGSSFERTVSGEILPPIVQQNQMPAPSVVSDVVNNLSEAIESATRPGNAFPMLNVEGAPSLNDVKNDLFWQLSKGAAQGVVDVTLPDAAPKKPSGSRITPDNIRIGDTKDFNPTSVAQTVGHMTGTGKACLPDSELDVASWGSAENVVGEFASNTTGLVGEFDRPDPEKLGRAVRYYISLGFGAEARLLLKGLEIAADDRAVWETMAHIVDLEPFPGGVFAEMEGCDSYAALWSALSSTALPPTKTITIPAVLRAFSALPLHLRRHLGPGLVDRFLEQNDVATARAIRDSILRAPGDHGASVDFLEAEIERANGDMAKAETLLEPIVGTTGPAGLASTIASIQLYINSGREAPHDLTTTAEALLLEATGGPDEDPLSEALALAYASQDRYAAAFGILAERGRDNAMLWQMLANTGADSEILTFAVFSSAENAPTLESKTEQALAQRLIALGFPDNALYWLSELHREGGVLSVADRLIIAQAELQRMDAGAAIDILEEISTEEAMRLRAESLALLGAGDAVKTFQSIGLTSDAAQVARHQGTWAELATMDVNDVWQEAAALVLGTNRPIHGIEQNDIQAVASQGQLAWTRELLNESANARVLLKKLISDQAHAVLSN